MEKASVSSTAEEQELLRQFTLVRAKQPKADGGGATNSKVRTLIHRAETLLDRWWSYVCGSAETMNLSQYVQVMSSVIESLTGVKRFMPFVQSIATSDFDKCANGAPTITRAQFDDSLCSAIDFMFGLFRNFSAPDAQARDCFVDSPRLHVYKSGSSHRLGNRLNPAPTDYDPKPLGRSPSFSFGSRTKLLDAVIPSTPGPTATHGSFEMRGPKFSGLDYKNSVIAAHSKARSSKSSIPRWLDDPSFVAGAANSNSDVVAPRHADDTEESQRPACQKLVKATVMHVVKRTFRNARSSRSYSTSDARPHSSSSRNKTVPADADQNARYLIRYEDDYEAYSAQVDDETKAELDDGWHMLTEAPEEQYTRTRRRSRIPRSRPGTAPAVLRSPAHQVASSEASIESFPASDLPAGTTPIHTQLQHMLEDDRMVDLGTRTDVKVSVMPRWDPTSLDNRLPRNPLDHTRVSLYQPNRVVSTTTIAPIARPRVSYTAAGKKVLSKPHRDQGVTESVMLGKLLAAASTTATQTQYS